MAKILRDYKCEEHGYFEAYRPECPHNGCDAEVYMVLLKAPGIISDRTKHTDSTLSNLASDFKMSDIKSAREGDSQAGYYTRNNVQPEPNEPRPRDAAIWGGAGGMSMQSVINGSIKPVRDEQVSIAPKTAGNFTGPRPGSYTADHQNLKIET